MRPAQALRDHAFDHGLRQSREQLDASQQGFLEGDLAVHCPASDLGDLGLDAGEVGHFIDTFDFDHRTVHAAEKQPLAPMLRGRHSVIEWQPAHEFLQWRGGVGGLEKWRCDLRRLIVRKPSRVAPQQARRVLNHPPVERLAHRVGDEAGEGRYGVSLQCPVDGGASCAGVLGTASSTNKHAGRA